MESKRGRDEIDERRSLLQSDPLKIAVASDLSALQLPANAQPIVRSLQRQMDVLAGLQFNDRQSAGTSHGEEVENAVFAPGIGKNLSVDESLIEHGIDTRDVLANNGFQPALSVGTVERRAGIAGKRVAMNFQIMQKTLQGRTRRGSEFLAGFVDSEKNAAIIPAREGKAAKAHPHFAGLRRGMQSYSLWCQCEGGIRRGPRQIQESFRFAMWDKPGIQVARAAGIDLFEDVQRGVMLVKLHSELRIECGETVRDGAADVLGKNQAKAGDRSPATRFARAAARVKRTRGYCRSRPMILRRARPGPRRVRSGGGGVPWRNCRRGSVRDRGESQGIQAFHPETARQEGR